MASDQQCYNKSSATSVTRCLRDPSCARCNQFSNEHRNYLLIPGCTGVVTPSERIAATYLETFSKRASGTNHGDVPFSLAKPSRIIPCARRYLNSGPLYCPAGSGTHLADGRRHCHHLASTVSPLFFTFGKGTLLYPRMRRTPPRNSLEAHWHTDRGGALTHNVATHTHGIHGSRSSFSPFSSHSLTSPCVPSVCGREAVLCRWRL